MTAITMVPERHWQREDKRFYQLLWFGVALWLVFAVLVPGLSVPERSRQLQEQLPPQLARVMLEERKAPPPPEPEPLPEQVVEPVKPEPKPEPKAEQVPAEPQPVIPDPQQARRQAEQAGLMAMRDDLAELRQSFQLNNTAPKVQSKGEAQATQVERKLLRNAAEKSFATAQAAAVAGDIVRSELADTGSTALAEAELKGLSATGRPETPDDSATTSERRVPGRSEATIRRVLEANKSSLYTLYSRALRANPLLKGKVVFDLVINPDGSLAEVSIVSSELLDSKLERQLILRLRSINFGAETAALTRSQWTVEFLPG
ncbi:AgmX/PglI C-terminal domain-containing protein [Rheinheimera maricola]|uniref:AgmX/PglI C-terminal domain-containing protein n=1 Tax=Rheinheimera maricola TaxID=2793282 RepID=A0ABS7X441_9GAMM|nr:AgmX/PglI C-terminal domain-containing protein [Rheinheimera maricola]MBZ9610071.1 AgmX/PglI C-terminal domain-containing protein [Rheinheimera maricola]